MPADSRSDGERGSLVLGPRDRLKGSLYVEGDLVVAGTVDGELEATGSVEIDGGGRVMGPVTARHKLVVGPSGSLRGDVRVSRLVVSDGATFSGNVAMVKPGEVATSIAPAPAPAEAANGGSVAAVETAAPVTPAGPAPEVAVAESPRPAASAKPAKAEAWEMLRKKGKQPDRGKGRRR